MDKKVDRMVYKKIDIKGDFTFKSKFILKSL